MQLVNIRNSSFENCVFLLCLQVTIIYHHLMPLDWMLSSLAGVIPVQIASEHRSDRYALQLLHFKTSSSAKIQNFHSSVQLSQRMCSISRPRHASQKTGEYVFERCKVFMKTFKRNGGKKKQQKQNKAHFARTFQPRACVSSAFLCFCFTCRRLTFQVERSENRNQYWFRRLQTNQLRFL